MVVTEDLNRGVYNYRGPQVLGIGVELAAVIFPAPLLLAIRPAANKLLGMITGRLEKLLAVATTAITHQSAPNQDASRPL